MSVGVIDVMMRAIAWTAGVVDGILTAMRQGRGRRPIVREVDPFEGLRKAILGRTRAQIARAMGAPVTASLGFGVRTAEREPVTFWDATTWYYPFDPAENKAIAIRFVGCRAREVELICLPK